MLTAACSDVVPSAPPPETKSGRLSAKAAAPAPRGLLPDWADEPDSALWKALTTTDSVLAVGLKRPGTRRGVDERGRPTLSRAEWSQTVRLARALDRVQVLSVDDTHLPVVRLKVRDMAAMSRIRRLPWVDYAEPSAEKIMPASGGCYRVSSYSGDNQSPYGSRPLAVLPTAGGLDSMSAALAWNMRVADAWRVSTGAGVTIGIMDTGLDATNNQFAANFSAGLSAGRWIRTAQTFLREPAGSIVEPQTDAPLCSHGTRIAGVAAAPRDGRGAVGVAYGANLYSVYQAHGEIINTNGWAATAIHNAARNGAKVIIMAWGKDRRSTVIQDEINAHHYISPDPNVTDDDVVFVGAAGTCLRGIDGLCDLVSPMESAVFPASMQEVLAVAGANEDGTRFPTSYDYGEKPGVVAYTALATTGKRYDPLTVIEGSSGATAAVGGVAALVRARFPMMTARDVMSQLIFTAGNACGAPWTWRNALVNAYAAVGGFCVPRIDGPGTIYMPLNSTTYADFTAVAQGGSGQYTYQWSNGATSRTTTFPFTLGSVVPVGGATSQFWVRVRDVVEGTEQTRNLVVNIQPEYDGMGPCPYPLDGGICPMAAPLRGERTAGARRRSRD